MNKFYKSEESFRVALHQRLMKRANECHMDIQELMKKVAFDRFLCRLFSQPDNPWFLKGGYALEMYFENSRTTKDIDLVLREYKLPSDIIENINEIDLIKANLMAHTQNNLDDFFSFILTGEEKNLDNTPYGGKRYSIECRIAGRRYVSFHIDVSVNDVSKYPYSKTVEGEDWLGFAGLPPLKCNILAPEEIFAEKIHAYTLPRTQENSRVRDIVDMHLLITSERMDANRLAECIKKVFSRRKTHPIPNRLEEPPMSWKQRYTEISNNCGIDKEMLEVFNDIDSYLQKCPILNVEAVHQT